MEDRVGMFWCSVALICLAGCPSPSSAPPPVELPLRGQTVEIVVPADLALRDLWEPLVQEWHAATGGDTQWSEYDEEHPPWKQRRDGIPNGGRLMVVPLAALSDADAAGIASPFPQGVVDQVDGRDIFPGLKDAVLSRQKRLIAVPVSAPVLLCYYRKDLLEAAGKGAPRSWDEYQQLIDDLPNWAPGLSALEPCGPEFRAKVFLARSAAYCKHPQNYSVWFDFQTGEPLFDTPGFERALEATQKAWSKMSEEIWSLSPLDCRRAILSGRAALALTWEPSAAYPKPVGAEPESTERGNLPAEPLPIGVVRLPGSETVYHRDAKRWETLAGSAINQPGFVGFSGLALIVDAPGDQAAAWHLLPMLTKRQDQAFAERPRSPCRESESATAWFADARLSPETSSLIADAAAETLRRRDVVCDLAIPHAEELHRILADELASLKSGKRAVPEVLAAINDRIAVATRERKSAVRDSYRRSLGLPPLK
jgi:ABC-type glycerol-3-phosphate transport system substrate-binding protein